MSDNSDEEDDHSMWSRPFTFGRQKVRVEEGWGIGIGGTVWEGGVLLAQYLSSNAFPKHHFQGARCLELGAGATGLPSLVAAELGCFSQVVVTDVDECLEALHDNISANLPAHCRLVPKCLAQPNALLQSARSSNRHSDAEATCLANVSPDVQGSQHQTHQDDLDSAEPACLPSTKPDTQSNEHSAGQNHLDSAESASLASVNPDPQSNQRHASGDDLHVASLASMNLNPQSNEQNASGAHLDTASPSASAVLPAIANPDLQSNKQNTRGHPSGTTSASAAPSVSTRQEANCTQARPTAATEVLVAELDWGHDATALQLPFEVILIADVVYVPEAMQSLLECMHAVSSPSSTVLLAFYKRFAEASDVFWQLLPKYFACEKIPEASYGAKAQPANVGLFQLRRVQIA